MTVKRRYTQCCPEPFIFEPSRKTRLSQAIETDDIQCRNGSAACTGAKRIQVSYESLKPLRKNRLINPLLTAPAPPNRNVQDQVVRIIKGPDVCPCTIILEGEIEFRIEGDVDLLR